MKRAAALLLVSACQAPTIGVEKQAPSNERRLTIESWHLTLTSRERDKTSASRLDNIVDALNKDDPADVVCLSGLLFDDQREALVAKVSARYKHVAFKRTDRTTPIEDPTDLQGVPQKVDMTAPCRDPADVARLDALAACARDTCRDAANIIDPACVDDKCKTLEQPNDLRCMVCLQSASHGEKAEDIHRTCVDTPRGELIADGRLGAVILSRIPFKEAETRVHVFPSTTSTNGALSATIEADGRALSVVCMSGELAKPIYTGPFGAPLPGTDFELYLAHRRMIDLGVKLGAERPTILLGGHGLLWTLGGGGLPRSVAYYELAANLNALLAPTTGLCTYCRDNPLTKLSPMMPGYPAIFDELLFVRGAEPIVEAVALAHDQPRYSFSGTAVPASVCHAARVTFRIP